MTVLVCLCGSWSEAPKTGFLLPQLKSQMVRSLTCLTPKHYLRSEDKWLHSYHANTAQLICSFFSPRQKIKVQTLQSPCVTYGTCHCVKYNQADRVCSYCITQYHILCQYLSHLMGKPTICIGENKGADQLRGNREADQRLCFRYSDSTIPLLLKSEISNF